MRIPLDEEQRQQVQKMDIESLAKVVFCYLKENLDPSPESERKFYSSVRGLWGVLFPGERNSLSLSDYAKLLEAIILLERRGLVMRDISYPTSANNQKDFLVCLTSIGVKSSIDDEVILLVDKPEEILTALEQKVGNLDEVVRQYYLESLRAYQEGLYISSVICLGAASERAIYWLAETIESYSEKYQEEIEKRRNGNIARLTEYLSNTVIPNTFVNDKDFARELKDLLDGLGNLYRENRNEAGHPKTIYQSWLEEDQGRLLIYFRRYITTICEAIGRII